MNILKQFAHRHFRCPFEIIGRKEKRIMTCELPPDPQKIFWIAQNAFQKFYRDTEKLGLIFKLPREAFADCTDLKDMNKILPLYQSLLLTAELDVRLHPFLPHQFIAGSESFKQLIDSTKETYDYKVDIVKLILGAIKHHKFPYPKTYRDLAGWIAHQLIQGIKNGDKNPNLMLGIEPSKPLLLISGGGTHFEYEEQFSSNSKMNQNSFWLVRSPLYPKPFGRYSHDFEIVVTRQADFAKIPPEYRETIRKLSNTVLEHHKVFIKDNAKDTQDGGFWIPTFR